MVGGWLVSEWDVFVCVLVGGGELVEFVWGLSVCCLGGGVGGLGPGPGGHDQES